MNTRRKLIFQFLMKEGCSRVHVMGLICADARIKVANIAEEAGLLRSHLNKMLDGKRPVCDSARQAYIRRVGFDPWMDM